MYIPDPFAATDRETLLAFIRANPFGQLISTFHGRPFVSHLPFLANADGTRLTTHLARRNPQWEEIGDQEVLVTIQGPHGYVSPTHYDSPGVPTWNYQAVHVYGHAMVITDDERLRAMVDELAHHHERGREPAWSPEYRPALLDAIVGIEIAVGEIQGKFKLSQNRPEDDRQRVVESLRQDGENRLADAMTEALAPTKQLSEW
ncbi:FMN-binding negative transcriptional regulator [Endothiovibrio diazotrophicus]